MNTPILLRLEPSGGHGEMRVVDAVSGRPVEGVRRADFTALPKNGTDAPNLLVLEVTSFEIDTFVRHGAALIEAARPAPASPTARSFATEARTLDED